MFGVLLLLGVAVIGILFYRASRENARYYEERNLKYKGIFDSVKNILSLISAQFNGFEVGQNMYNLFPDEP